MTARAPEGVSNPFPGLRPFREDEEPLFFGRESQVDAMVDKLAVTRFLVVVGTSGSGKSSLVNCGLIPALHRGLMAEAGSAWQVAVLRPGNRPMRALAEALARPGLLAPTSVDDTGFAPAELVEATLRMGRLGLVDAFEQAHLDPRQQLLVVVDQFEELFRYQGLTAPDAAGATGHASEDATAFVNLLLQATAQRRWPLYVVLTMRSDFLGDCAQFFGLPEAINRGQYLVPRLTRDERRLAITGPLGVAHATIDPPLLTRLVNDVGDNPDQLSVLQHALNRTWAQWRREGAQGAIALHHYDAIGTMAQALNQHAEEAYAALGSDRRRHVCAALFKAITDKTSDVRGTRRPTRLDSLVAITGASADELVAVIDVFREPSRSFLMPPAGVAIGAETPIDIAHESLMRVWKQLRDWADDEARSAQTYRRIAETADLERAGDAALLRQPDLQFALDWREREHPTAPWAARYRGGFDATMAFLRRSEETLAEEARVEAERRADQARVVEQQRRTRRLLGVVLPAVLVLLGLLGVSLWLYADATRQRRRADVETVKAQAEAAAARLARQRAEDEAATARRAVDESRRLYAATGADPGVRRRIEQVVENKSVVYLQFADPAQRSVAERLRLHLEESRYSAPGAEQVGSVPFRSELRYFRDADAAEADSLAALLRRWNWGPLRPRFIKTNQRPSQLRQFEIWLARSDSAEIARLLRQINAPTPEERKGAGQALQDRYTASPPAIAGALALFAPNRIDALTTDGRINALYYLTRTAPLAWDATLEGRGREVLARIRSRGNPGPATLAEVNRLERLLDAVRAGAPAPPR